MAGEDSRVKLPGRFTGMEARVRPKGFGIGSSLNEDCGSDDGVDKGTLVLTAEAALPGVGMGIFSKI